MIGQIKAAILSMKGILLISSVVIIGGIITYQHFALTSERDKRYAAEAELATLKQAFDDMQEEHRKQLDVIMQEVEHERKRTARATATIKELQRYEDGDVSPALRYAIDSLYGSHDGSESR